MANYKIPSDEDFARADKWMAERMLHLTDVCENVKRRFISSCPLHNVYLLYQEDVDFRAYVFFKMDQDVLDCTENGTMKAIEDAIYEELERYGRGTRGEIVVAFEWDSDENVDNKFGGDYLLRLR